MHLINGVRIAPHSPNSNGWRALSLEAAEPYAGEAPGVIGESLLNLVHLTDTHICDAQSPARVEFLDRYADPHHPLAPVIGTLVGTYRAQESLTTQVLESMLQRISRIDRTPVTKSKIDALILTGDLVDNAQLNELNWFSSLLNGGLVQPDSGNQNRWEGVGAASNYSEHYWNPHGTPPGELDDFPRSKYGFPLIPELLDAVRSSFYGSGSSLPWYAVHGNHDALLQGTVVPSKQLVEVAIGSRKFKEISDLDALAVLQQISEIGPAKYPSADQASWVTVEGDAKRTFLKETDFYSHLLSRGSTHGGITMQDSQARYWSLHLPMVRLISLDTVNPHGGWQGSIDEEQLRWLEEQLQEDRNTPTIILSHHPVQDLVNLYRPPQSPLRFGTDAVTKTLLSASNVFLWLAGHSHRNRISHHGDDGRGFWQIETSSLIDWPQQGRLIEIFRGNPGELIVATTMIDHCGTVAPDISHLMLDDVHELAGLSRLLAVNDWQRRSGPFAVSQNEGSFGDRNRFISVRTEFR